MLIKSAQQIQGPFIMHVSYKKEAIRKNRELCRIMTVDDRVASSSQQSVFTTLFAHWGLSADDSRLQLDVQKVGCCHRTNCNTSKSNTIAQTRSQVLVNDTFPGSEWSTSVKALAKQFTLQHNMVVTPIMASNVVNVACFSRCRWQKHRYMQYYTPCCTYALYMNTIFKRYTEVMIELLVK